MSHDDPPKPKSPKADLEQRLVQRAIEPFLPWLTEAEEDGMRLFLDLFVGTHPAMRRMVDRRLTEQAAMERAATARREAADHSTVVSKKDDTSRSRTAPEASGVAPKTGARRGPKHGAGGDQ